MTLAAHMTPERMLPRLSCRDKREIIARMVAPLAADGTVSAPERLAADVLRRENEEPTAFGGGLSLPHARSPHIRELALVVATLAEPLDMGASDGRPVDVVMLSVGPLRDPRGMLRVLARLARLVKRKKFLDSLRGCEGPQEMLDAVKAADRAS